MPNEPIVMDSDDILTDLKRKCERLGAENKALRELASTSAGVMRVLETYKNHFGSWQEVNYCRLNRAFVALGSELRKRVE